MGAKDATKTGLLGIVLGPLLAQSWWTRDVCCLKMLLGGATACGVARLHKGGAQVRQSLVQERK
jgi:hypothetical protein